MRGAIVSEDEDEDEGSTMVRSCRGGSDGKLA